MMRHDPHAKLDYQIDWSAYLAGDTISQSAWEVAGGLVVDSHSNTTSAATVWLTVEPGVLGRATATNTITTVGGRTDQRTLEILIVNQ